MTVQVSALIRELEAVGYRRIEDQSGVLVMVKPAGRDGRVIQQRIDPAHPECRPGDIRVRYQSR